MAPTTDLRWCQVVEDTQYLLDVVHRLHFLACAQQFFPISLIVSKREPSSKLPGRWGALVANGIRASSTWHIELQMSDDT